MAGHKIFLFGIDRAGKTALAESLKKGEIITNTRPTIAFTIGAWVVDDITFQIWDAPGQPPFRKLWKNGFEKAEILLFVLDTADKARFNESYAEFSKIINDFETRGLPLIFCFNKMDLPDAVNNKNDARAIFRLPTITDRKVMILETSIKDKNSIKNIRDAFSQLVIANRW
jgi:small GTP-binding protein